MDDVHVRLTQAFSEDDGDTLADAQESAPPKRRRQRVRPSRQEFEVEADAGESSEVLGTRGEPGPTLARSALTEVCMREAIVRRNHRIDRAEARARTPVPEHRPALVRVDWFRCSVRGLKFERVGRDAFRVRGRIEDRDTTASTSSRSSGPAPRLSLGLDGEMYTVGLQSGDDTTDVARRVIRRVQGHYEIECEIEEDAMLIRLVRPRLH